MRKVSAKHTQWLKKELPILESEGVVSSEVAGRLKSYYDENTASGMHWAVIGSPLIGSGVILLFAHNWDELSRPRGAVVLPAVDRFGFEHCCAEWTDLSPTERYAGFPADMGVAHYAAHVPAAFDGIVSDLSWPWLAVGAAWRRIPTDRRPGSGS